MGTVGVAGVDLFILGAPLMSDGLFPINTIALASIGQVQLVAVALFVEDVLDEEHEQDIALLVILIPS